MTQLWELRNIIKWFLALHSDQIAALHNAESALDMLLEKRRYNVIGSRGFHVIITRHTLAAGSNKRRDSYNYYVCGLCPSSGILNIENTMFRKMDLFPSSVSR
jgi:hypothetical protein